MAIITVRNLPEGTHRALKTRAAAHGRSAEAEVQSIVQDAVFGTVNEGFGTRVARVAAEVGGFDLYVERSATSTDPIDFA